MAAPATPISTSFTPRDMRGPGVGGVLGEGMVVSQVVRQAALMRPKQAAKPPAVIPAAAEARAKPIRLRHRAAPGAPQTTAP